MRFQTIAVAFLFVEASASLAQTPAPAPLVPVEAEKATELRGVAEIQSDAQKLLPLFQTEIAREFLRAAEQLPRIEPRKVFVNKEARTWLTPEEATGLPEDQRAKLEERNLDEEFYYNTGYGSPLAYARVLEIVGRAVPAFRSLVKRDVLDFGYGTIGQLRMMAACSAHALGIDVDAKLAALYREAADRGKIMSGSVQLIHGRWPAFQPAIDAVNAAAHGNSPYGFDLITSKNTLKNGYINPEREVDERMLVKLGVPNEQFVNAVFESLKPGGIFIIYNICPRLSREDEPYKPWSDGRCPFPRAMLENAGLEVVAFDINDDAAAREIFTTLGYPIKNDKDEDDIFAWFTLCRRPGGR